MHAAGLPSPGASAVLQYGVLHKGHQCETLTRQDLWYSAESAKTSDQYLIRGQLELFLTRASSLSVEMGECSRQMRLSGARNDGMPSLELFPPLPPLSSWYPKGVVQQPGWSSSHATHAGLAGYVSRYQGTWHLGAQGPQLTWPAWTHSVTRAKPQPWTCDIILYILLPGRPRISPISQPTSCPPPAEAPSNPSHRLQSSTEIANRWARHHVRPSPRHEPRRAFRGREATHHRELLQQEGRRWLRCAPEQALSLQSAPLRVTC